MALARLLKGYSYSDCAITMALLKVCGVNAAGGVTAGDDH